MTCNSFQLLPNQAQVTWVLNNGTFLIQRWEEMDCLNLYYLPDSARGFFAEVGVNHAQDDFVVRRSFSSSKPLQEYAHWISLPQL